MSHSLWELFDWDEDRIEHIAGHHVTIDEACEVYCSRHLKIRHGKDRYRIYGQTNAGRYLIVVVGKTRWSSKDWLVTARDMTAAERRYYERSGR